jgi:hypothetical protein
VRKLPLDIDQVANHSRPILHRSFRAIRLSAPVALYLLLLSFLHLPCPWLNKVCSLHIHTVRFRAELASSVIVTNTSLFHADVSMKAALVPTRTLEMTWPFQELMFEHVELGGGDRGVVVTAHLG